MEYIVLTKSTLMAGEIVRAVWPQHIRESLQYTSRQILLSWT